MKTIYNNTQIWKLPIIFFLWFNIFFLIISIINKEFLSLSILSVVFLICLLLFYKLNISINESKIHLKYWIWLIQKSFLLNEIKSVKIVKNKWYYGWGIRVLFFPMIVIFNISWLDAIEIVMSNNNVFRIWSNDVEKLSEVVWKMIK